RAKTFSPPAITIMTSRCWMEKSQPCRRVRQTQSMKLKTPCAMLAVTSQKTNTAPAFTKRSNTFFCSGALWASSLIHSAVIDRRYKLGDHPQIYSDCSEELGICEGVRV